MSTERLIKLIQGSLASPKTPAHLKAGLKKKLDSLMPKTMAAAANTNLAGLEITNEDVPF